MISNKLLKTALYSALAICAVASVQTQAAESAVMVVNATVMDNCTIEASRLEFGSYDPIAANAETALTGTGAVVVLCTMDTAATITLSGGMNPGNDATERYMVGDSLPGLVGTPKGGGGPAGLAYGLYSDASMTQLWGDDIGNSVSHTGTGEATELTVYGRIPGGQNVGASVYYDTVIATVVF